jgi:riboflavin synthase
MFTGIVETVGTIDHIDTSGDCLHLTISPLIVFDDLHIGDSVAINGVCLTVTHFSSANFQVTVVPETLRLTNLSKLSVGSKINLERSMQANARLGGHYVQGHVDGIGEIIDILADGEKAWIAKIGIEPALEKYVIKKGYIGIDGMSITVMDTTPTWFTVTLIPHTQDVTIVKQYAIGAKVNIEVDMLGKYVEKILLSQKSL